MKVRFVDEISGDTLIEKNLSQFAYHEGDFISYGGTNYKVEKTTVELIPTHPSGSFSDSQWTENVEVRLSIVP